MMETVKEYVNLRHGCVVGRVLRYGRVKKRTIFIVLSFLLIFCFFTGCDKEAVLKMIYPVKYEEYVEKYAEEYNLDKYMVYAMIKVESGFDPKAESAAGAKGLMQLMEETAAECSEKEDFGYTIPDDLYVPEYNIRLGCYYLKYLLENYGDMRLAVIAYNGGTGNLEQWLADETLTDENGVLNEIPYEETKKYVEKVFTAFDAYNSIYNGNEENDTEELQ